MLVYLVFAAAVAACPGASEKTVFWGDLHIHTAYSMDAYVFNNRDDPASAYRFARGQPRRLLDGSTISIDRPLDFAAVTDHAEYFGVMGICRGLGRSPYCDELDTVSDGHSRKGFSDFFLPFVTKNLPICPVDPKACTDAAVDLWQRTIDAAESAYEPCEFTTFIANEWTRSPNNLHWHRNLISS